MSCEIQFLENNLFNLYYSVPLPSILLLGLEFELFSFLRFAASKSKSKVLEIESENRESKSADKHALLRQPLGLKDKQIMKFYLWFVRS